MVKDSGQARKTDNNYHLTQEIMPIKIERKLPAFKTLKEKGVFVMDFDRAEHQDIRPLQIGLLNLMPTKEITETQIFRMIGSSPLQIEPRLIHMESHVSKNTSQEHLESFYTNFSEIKKQGLDGLIITGAPVEQLEFHQVNYWEELKEIMDWSKDYVASTLFLCWGAQAGLNHFYDIPKWRLKKKIFGVFKHIHNDAIPALTRGLDDEFWVPHSRHTEVLKEDILKCQDLQILAESKDSGVHLIANQNASQIFATGHWEYDRGTLALEYFRDVDKGLEIEKPKNYFPEDDDKRTPRLRWRANAETFFRNWVNFVYQETPFDLRIP